MNEPIDRLGAADPAAGLGPQPDERAQSDLRLLLGEPRRVAPAPVSPEGRRLTPVLVTAVVAIAVIAVTVAVLGFVRPRADVGHTSTPTVGSSSCHPLQVLPFRCGTYRSTYGGKAITGDLGGPAKDRLSISFTAQQGALLLTAATQNCFAERVLVRWRSNRLDRVSSPVYSENACHGSGADKRSWAYAFLNGPLKIESVDGPYFGTGASSVFFNYLGSAPLGAAQLPRNDKGCVAAHVQPFPCGKYRSTEGTGTLTFLDSSTYKLAFTRLDAEPTAELLGACNSLSVAFETDGNSLVVTGNSSTLELCAGDRGAHDNAVSTFFSGTLTYRVAENRITFTKGASSATFQR